MKKSICFILVFCSVITLLSAQEQSIKVYLNDGSEKNYNISDIKNFSTIKAYQNLFMKIYFKDSTIEAFSASGVVYMLFNNNKIQVYTLSCMTEYEIFKIDSIIYTQNSDIVRICDQVWMTRNLDVDHYRNGDSIPQVTDRKEWANLTKGAWCYYYNNDSAGNIYGKLYNWYAVNDARGLAPKGWHVPSDSEWTVLTYYLGGEYVAGGKLKEAGIVHWIEPNRSATNESGFTGLPGSWCGLYGEFFPNGFDGFWWSATEYDATDAWFRQLSNDDANITRYFFSKKDGHSVRCIKN